MRHLKTGDKVICISGKNKDVVGIIEKIDNVKGFVYLSGVNEGKKHVKPTQKDPDGGILTVSRPIHISNVMYVEGQTKKKKDTKVIVSRVGFKKEKDGSKKRVLRKTGDVID